ncbi:MAG: hypothetical protein AB8B53_03090 [Flavobacteriales bacterium]
MKNLTQLTFVLLLLLGTSDKINAQDFIHNSVSITYSKNEVILYYGLTTATELEALFTDSHSKTKVSTSGKGSEKTYTMTRKIVLSDGKTMVYFTASGSNKVIVEKDLTLQSIHVKKGSLALINHKTWFLKNRKHLLSDLGTPVKEKKSNTYYYPEKGILIRFYSQSTLAMPKRITFYESPEVADKNFQIYLDWKSKQEE